MKQALGLIETIGLVSAIEAADAAVKAANVVLLGYENTKGSGKITVKIAGDVGAVQAGVAAGVAAAGRVGQVYSQLIIARPHEEISALIQNLDRGRGLVEEEQETAVAEPQPEPEQALPPVEIPAAPEHDEAIEEIEQVQCEAVTKSGSRCQLNAQPGSAYCHVHRSLEEEE